MVKTHKRRKTVQKILQVSRTSLMNLSQLLPKKTKYGQPSQVAAPVEWKNNTYLMMAQKNERAQLLNLSVKVKTEYNKPMRFTIEGSESNLSTHPSKSDKTPPNYYLHKVLIGEMEDRSKETEYTAFKDHFQNTRKVFGIINQIREQLPEEAVNCQELRAKTDRKLLVLDLDETLISSNECPPHNWDNTHIVHFQLPNKFTYIIYVKFRPYVIEFLESMSRHFDIAIFTASEKTYADAIIDKLDPERRFISKRYYNSDCDQLNGIFVKDVSKLGRPLKDVIIVDNTVLCFAFQLANGIPILSYYGDNKVNDRELLELKDFLLYLKDFNDVTVPISEFFKWDRITENYREEKKTFEAIFCE